MWLCAKLILSQISMWITLLPGVVIPRPTQFYPSSCVFFTTVSPFMPPPLLENEGCETLVSCAHVPTDFYEPKTITLNTQLTFCS